MSSGEPFKRLIWQPKQEEACGTTCKLCTSVFTQLTPIPQRAKICQVACVHKGCGGHDAGCMTMLVGCVSCFQYHQIDCHLQFQECFSGPKTQKKRMAGQLYSEDASAAHVSLGSLWKALEWLRKSLLELRQLRKGLVSFHRNTSYYTACPNKSFHIGNDVIAYIKMTAPKQRHPSLMK